MNIDKIRRDTPGCADKLFVNSAGASLVPRPVFDAVSGYLQEEQKVGGYFLADQRLEDIRLFYHHAAELLHCAPGNIAFCHDATDAFTKALSAISFQKGDIILTTDDDYVSNHLNFIGLRDRLGITLVKGRNNANGDLDVAHFSELIAKHRPTLVSVTHIPTNSGLIQDVQAVGKICREYDCTYIVDACQSVGQIPVNVSEIQCDYLSATGRKFIRGPRGTGLLYVSDRMLDKGQHPLLVDLHGATWEEEFEYTLRQDAGRFEYWEKPYALQIGLSEALKYILEIGINEIASYNQQIMKRLRKNLSGIKGVHTYDRGSELASILTFRKEGMSQQSIKEALNKQDVYYSVANIHNALLDFRKKNIEWAVRISPHYFNTEEEMDRLAAIIKDL